MATKNVRASLLTVQLNREQPYYLVVLSKPALQQYLYATAVQHWRRKLPGRVMPRNRKVAINTFFSMDSGNSFKVEHTMILGNQFCQKEAQRADKLVDRTVELSTK